HTQNLGITGLEVFLESFQAGNFLGSCWCPIQRIEHQHDIFLTFELIQREFCAPQMAGQLKVGRLFTDFNHDVFSSLKN
ncbi:MAG: hypothetical protein ACREO5_14115, partial [Candidatus Binatia bacterium]